METRNLLDVCPKCGAHLYAYQHTPCGDHLELTVWLVECSKCDYEEVAEFPSIEALAGEFTIE